MLINIYYEAVSCEEKEFVVGGAGSRMKEDKKKIIEINVVEGK